MDTGSSIVVPEAAGRPRAETTRLAADWHDRAGFCAPDPADEQPGVLDPGRRAHLRAMAERAQLTHDLVAACADRYDAFPAELATEQTRALAAVRGLLDRYGIEVATGAAESGAAGRDLDRLISRARASRAAALAVVASVLCETAEQLDAELPQVSAPDVRHLYLHLSTTTRRQLRLVQAWSGR